MAFGVQGENFRATHVIVIDYASNDVVGIEYMGFFLFTLKNTHVNESLL
jgi:hypothetical protein